MSDPKERRKRDTEPPVQRMRLERREKSPKLRKARRRPTDTAQVKSRKPRYSGKERSEKLSDIQQLTQEGESVKNAVKKVGISEATFYEWKKSVEPERPSGNLMELAKLEAENARLKRLLAEKLRDENAELKKKLELLH